MADGHLLARTLAEMSGNPDQLSAIQETSHCVVLAGPGSGKTRTLTTAMARALLEDVREPRGIACITYNNECAIELENRLSRLGIERGGRVYIGTVHSFAFSQVVIPYARSVFPELPPLKPATKQQVNDAITTAYGRVFNDGGNPKWVWARAKKKRWQDVDRTHPMWMGRSPELARFIEAYESELRRQGLVDFDDMPLLALRMIKEHEWIRNSLKAKFPVLFVDEYQDLGTALHELVLQLCFEAGMRLFAVGDPDQSIYRFAGADPELLKALARRTDVRTISLPFNYRCGVNIIEASKAALGEERDYRAPDGAHQGSILFDAVDGDLPEQVAFIMETLIPALRERGIDLDEIAVLYRTAEQGNDLAAAADARGIPIVRADNQALVPRNNRLSRLIEAAASWVTGGWKEADPPFRRLSSEASSFVHGGGASQDEYREVEGALASFLHRTINTTGSTHEWLTGFRDALVIPWRTRTREVSEDWDVIDRMIERTDPAQGNSEMPLPYFSGRIEETGRLNLSTLHSAKGREFDVVIIFGMNREMLPDERDRRGQEDLREARRLFYVAVTRARQELHLVFKRRHYSPWVAELYRRSQRTNQPPVPPPAT